MSEKLVESEREKQEELVMRSYFDSLDRLFRVAVTLKFRGAQLCSTQTTPLIGALWLDRKSFPKETKDMAAKILGLTDTHPRVLFIAPGSPAALAGLMPGDFITNVDGARITMSDWFGKTPSEFALSNFQKAGLRDVKIEIERAGRLQNLTITPQLGCRYPVSLVYNEIPRAFSDGERIGITTAMLGILKTDDELAFVLAHETAHNVLGHVDRKRANAAIGMLIGAIFDIGLAAGAGVNTQGLGMRTGADAGALAYSQEFEFEADYMGLYLIARAGFDITQASQVFRRLAVEHPETIQKGLLSTHPSTPERAVQSDATALEIQQKIKGRILLTPAKLNDPQSVARSTVPAAAPVSTPAITPVTQPGSFSLLQEKQSQIASIEKKPERKPTTKIFASMVQFDGPRVKYGITLDAEFMDDGSGSGAAKVTYPGNSQVLNGTYHPLSATESGKLRILEKDIVKKVTLREDVPSTLAVFSRGDTFMECIYGPAQPLNQKKGTCKDNYGNRYHLVFE